MSALFEKTCVPILGTLLDGMRAINEGNAGIAMVLDDHGCLVGTLTDGDVRRALLKSFALDSPLAPHISREFTAVAPGVERARVLDLMQARLLNQVPIVDNKGKLLGLHLLHEMIGAAERPNWAVIMAGGKGERLRPLTDSTPKPMIAVAGRPILERIILHLVGFGIRKIFVSVNYLGEMIEEHFRDGRDYGCHIDYLREKEPLGTCGSLSLLPRVPEHPLLVLNGDILTQFNVEQMLAFHREGHHKVTMGTKDYFHTVPFGVVEASNNAITQIREKPTHSWLINSGIYSLEPDLVDRIPKDTQFFMPVLIEDCLASGERVGAYHIGSDWLDIGRHKELKRARGEESNA